MQRLCNFGVQFLNFAGAHTRLTKFYSKLSKKNTVTVGHCPKKSFLMSDRYTYVRTYRHTMYTSVTYVRPVCM
jgi:hypothetical protein